MGYNKEFLKKALDEVVKKGEANRRKYDAKKAECYSREPRLTEIDNEFMRIGPMLGITAISGNKERLKALQVKCECLKKEREQLKEKAGLSEYSPCCKLCDDTGYIGTKLCTCVLNRAKELSFKALSAEMPLDDCRIDNFSLDYYTAPEDRAVMQKILDFCKKYTKELNTSSKSVLFFGGTGLGKTHLSLAIASAALEKGMGAVYSPAQNLLQKLEKEHFSYNSETPILDDVMDCDILIMDDLGTEFSTSFSQSLIYNIINTRLLSGKPTVISTNLTLEELADRYTPRVASRIIGCYTIKKFSGGDIRQQKRIEEMQKVKNND